MALLVVLLGAQSASSEPTRFHCDPLPLLSPDASALPADLDTVQSRTPGPATAPRTTDQRPTGPQTGSGWEPVEPIYLGVGGPNMVLDRERDRLLLFGVYYTDALRNMVWSRSLAHDEQPWQRMPVAGVHPAGMKDGVTVFDPVRARLITYGSDGVWALSVTGTMVWTQLALPGEGPGSLTGLAGVFDQSGDRLLLCAPAPDGTEAVWAMDCGAQPGWSKLVTTGTTPNGRDNAVVVLDSRRRRILLRSGYGEPAGDLWSLDLNGPPTWTALTAGGEAPPPMYQSAAAYDSLHDRLIVHGGVAAGYGAHADGWELPLSEPLMWRHHESVVQPIARNSGALVHDPDRDRFILFGGGVSDTWSLSLADSARWTMLEPDGDAQGEVGGYAGAAVYDERRHRTLDFGGQIRYYVHGTAQKASSPGLWSLRAEDPWRWQRVPVSTLPPARFGHALLLDPKSDRLLTIGGISSTFETPPWPGPWQYDLSGDGGWSRLFALGDLPRSRDLVSAVFDTLRERAIVFGGRADDGQALDDTWILELGGTRARWARADSTQTAPAGRFGASSAYDPISDRVVLFGGMRQDGTTLGDAWELPLSGDLRWTPSRDTRLPPARAFASMVLDPLRQRLVLFGGRSPAGLPMRDLWVLPLVPGAHWIALDTLGTLPRERWGATSVYDVDRDEMQILFGTYDPCADFPATMRDGWTYHTSDPIPQRPALIRVDPHPTSVLLQWSAPGAAADAAVLQREGTPGSWTRVGSVTAVTAGLLQAEDSGAVPGSSYHYRLVTRIGATATVSEPVTVTTTGLHLGIQSIASPSRTGVNVSYSLPDDSPARLELIDVLGRILDARDATRHGVGDHTIALAPPGRLPPGIYFVRLTQGEARRVARVELLH